MSSDIQPYILDELDTVIDQTVADIGLYTKNPGDFTRNRKLNATTTIKVTDNYACDIGKGVINCFSNCQTEREYKIADEMLTAVCGYCIDSLASKI